MGRMRWGIALMVSVYVFSDLSAEQVRAAVEAVDGWSLQPTCRGRGGRRSGGGGGYHRSYWQSSYSSRSYRAPLRPSRASRASRPTRHRTHRTFASRTRSAGSHSSRGCGTRNGPGYRLPNGKCASWADVGGQPQRLRIRAAARAATVAPAGAVQPVIVATPRRTLYTSSTSTAVVDGAPPASPPSDATSLETPTYASFKSSAVVDDAAPAPPPLDAAPPETPLPARCLLDDRRTTIEITCKNVTDFYPGRSVFWFVAGNVYSCSEADVVCPGGSRCVVAMRDRKDWSHGFTTGTCQ